MPATLADTYRAMARNNAWANHRLLAACAAPQPGRIRGAADGLLSEPQGDAEPHPDRRLVLRRWSGGRLARPQGMGRPGALRDGGRPAARAGRRRSPADCRLRSPDGGLARAAMCASTAIPASRPSVATGCCCMCSSTRSIIAARPTPCSSGTRVKPPQLDEFYSVAEAPLRAAEFAALGWTEETVWPGDEVAVPDRGLGRPS